jgi:cytochrome c553
MRNCITALVIALVLVPGVVAARPQQEQGEAGEPAWAYGFAAAPKPEETSPPPVTPGEPRDNVKQKHVLGSALAFTEKQIFDDFGPADWFPDDHPQMPDIVAHGRAKDISACALCHYPNGKGKPETASLAGLSYTYFVQTMEDFKNGLRKSADPRKGNSNRMVGFAKGMTDGEIKASAQYFSSMKWTPWIKVAETNTVPKTHTQNGLFIAEESNEEEPISGRIIEVPVNAETTETLRNPRSGFIAYAPIGSLKKGEDLVTTGGGGKTLPCGICHGPKLEGIGPVPPLAGRSPSYAARQLYDFQHGARNGPSAPLMQKVVANLTPDDMVAITAYLASVVP